MMIASILGLILFIFEVEKYAFYCTKVKNQFNLHLQSTNLYSFPDFLVQKRWQMFFEKKTYAAYWSLTAYKVKNHLVP